MLLKTLIGPIAAATVLNLFWFAAIWRGHQMERTTGKMPARFDAALGAYIAANLLAVFSVKDRTLTTGFDVFMAAFVSEAAGAVIVYGLLWGFVFTRGKPWTERAFPIGASVMMAGGMFATLFLS